MTERDETDLALEILVNLRSEIAPDVSEEILRACYYVQKSNQFSNDRSVPMTEMEKLIDTEVKRLAGEQEEQQ